MDHDHGNDRTPATRCAIGIKPVAVSLSNAPPTATPSSVMGRVSSRGGIQVAHQKIQVGMTHAGKIVTVVPENNSFRLVIDGDTVATVPRTTSYEINRYKAHATHPGKR
jgi:hypothetical protein